jgi:hypothetical protein
MGETVNLVLEGGGVQGIGLVGAFSVFGRVPSAEDGRPR